ncbi:hypothetical protein [Listeria seeligeri]|uniref:hypothetical protein n=1 Tax=Listeria seeligeri TaxID=1640 RepID=UPI002F400369
MLKKWREILFNFIENNLICYFISLYWELVLLIYIFRIPWGVLVDFFNDIMKYFYSQQDMMVTSATVLIGIYFTMYTIFAVYNSSSVISKLYSESFQKLLKLLKYAMVSSILVLVFGFLSDWLCSVNEIFTYIINFFFSLYFIITSLICGIYIYMILKKDIDGLDGQRKLNKEKEVLQNDLKVFLEREQMKEDKRISDENKKKLAKNNLKMGN